jgi:hypothetical protein
MNWLDKLVNIDIDFFVSNTSLLHASHTHIYVCVCVRERETFSIMTLSIMASIIISI